MEVLTNISDSYNKPATSCPSAINPTPHRHAITSVTQPPITTQRCGLMLHNKRDLELVSWGRYKSPSAVPLSSAPRGSRSAH
ncbi:hypothetical protein E2C01_013863 [Portunus trituberculatus]|uniref:Uncharacterized protein n=1 Tax=Portunus trituberculatus TaxID=210409 RepID=A0A5B7DIL8_PORTR|nr:hypothetical protein [Portunus trituberculatus]